MILEAENNNNNKLNNTRRSRFEKKINGNKNTPEKFILNSSGFTNDSNKFKLRNRFDIENEDWYKYQLIVLKYWDKFSKIVNKILKVIFKYGLIFFGGVLFAYGDLLGVGKLEIGFTEFLVKVGELLQQLQI